MIPIYAFLQRPTYASILVEATPDDAHWIAALAFCKVLYGLVFYTLFFSPPQTDAKVHLPAFRVQGPLLTSAVRWAIGVVGAAVLSSFSTSAAHWLGGILDPMK